MTLGNLDSGATGLNLPEGSSPSQPEAYEILVRGEFVRLDSLAELFPISVEAGEDVTRLTGVLPDQAALFGLLRQLRDLGLTLVALRSGLAVQSGQAAEPATPSSDHGDSV